MEARAGDARKAFVLRQVEEGRAVAEVCREAGISSATYFNWKKKYAELLPSDMRRLGKKEDEDSRLKRIVADLTLDCERGCSMSMKMGLNSDE